MAVQYHKACGWNVFALLCCPRQYLLPTWVIFLAGICRWILRLMYLLLWPLSDWFLLGADPWMSDMSCSPWPSLFLSSWDCEGVLFLGYSFSIQHPVHRQKAAGGGGLECFYTGLCHVCCDVSYVRLGRGSSACQVILLWLLGTVTAYFPPFCFFLLCLIALRNRFRVTNYPAFA